MKILLFVAIMASVLVACKSDDITFVLVNESGEDISEVMLEVDSVLAVVPTLANESSVEIEYDVGGETGVSVAYVKPDGQRREHWADYLESGAGGTLTIRIMEDTLATERRYF